MTPQVFHVVSCLPCGHREAVRPGNALPPRCPNCGGEVHERVESIDTVPELRDVRREGRRSVRFARPRLVVGAPA